jgi:hypothetical protein
MDDLRRFSEHLAVRGVPNSAGSFAELRNRERAPDLVVHRMRAGKDAGHLLSAAAHEAGVPGTRRDQPLADARLPG